MFWRKPPTPKPEPKPEPMIAMFEMVMRNGDIAREWEKFDGCDYYKPEPQETGRLVRICDHWFNIDDVVSISVTYEEAPQ